MKMNERVTTALQHRQPDAVPVDFGATPVSGIHCSVVAALREKLGLPARPVKVVEPYQMLGEVDDELKAALGVDTVGVAPRNTIFGFPNEDWREWRAPWGQTVLVSRHFQVEQRPDGHYIFPAGDRAAPPSGHLPNGGYFFDALVRQPPLDEDHLNPEDNLEEFGPLPEADIRRFQDETAAARATGRAVIANFGGTAFGDIALVPAPFLRRPRGVRDIADIPCPSAPRTRCGNRCCNAAKSSPPAAASFLTRFTMCRRAPRWKMCSPCAPPCGNLTAGERRRKVGRSG